MKLNELQEAWLEALTSGKYRQGQTRLRDEVPDKEGSRIEFCCLGVACHLAIERGLIPEYNGTLGFPPTTVTNAFGFIDDQGMDMDDGNDSVSGLRGTGRLAILNDTVGLDFTQIASAVRGAPEKFFVQAEAETGVTP